MTPVAYLYSGGRNRHISDGHVLPSSLCGKWMLTDTEMVGEEIRSKRPGDPATRIARNRALPVCGSCLRIWGKQQAAGR